MASTQMQSASTAAFTAGRRNGAIRIAPRKNRTQHTIVSALPKQVYQSDICIQSADIPTGVSMLALGPTKVLTEDRVMNMQKGCSSLMSRNDLQPLASDIDTRCIVL